MYVEHRIQAHVGAQPSSNNPLSYTHVTHCNYRYFNSNYICWSQGTRDMRTYYLVSTTLLGFALNDESVMQWSNIHGTSPSGYAT